MSDYKPNSHKYKAEQAAQAENKKRAEKVISGKAKTKKNEVRKLKDVFISEDIHNVKQYVFMDVLVPALKKAVSDIVRNGIDMILYGESGRSQNRSISSKVSYRNYYDQGDDRRRSTVRPRNQFEYDELVFETRGDAEAVICQMEDMLERYGMVSIGDMYDMAEITAPYTSYKYGWTNLPNIKAVRAGDGYIIQLPKALPLD